ncbi:hypothetical protein JCM9279_007437 [Rhodotorula babjevae]
MSSSNSTIVLEGFPLPPEGANPFAYYEEALAASLKRQANLGFVVRQSVLCALLGYTILVAAANVFVVIRDGRRRGKKLFLWRLLARERGRYIVGNRQVLEPLLTFLVTPFLMAHIANEWVTTFGTGYSDSTGPLRLVPWLLLFIQIWLVSWASLQSYIITASDTTRFVRAMSPRVTNGLFLGLGAAMFIMLIVGTCFGIRAGVYLGNALNATKVALDRAAEAWPDVPPSAVAEIENDWHKVDEARNQTNEASLVVMTAFVVSPFLTALINVGGIALLVIVHRQIAENHRTFTRGGQITQFAPDTAAPEIVEHDEHDDANADAVAEEPTSSSPPPVRPPMPNRTSTGTVTHGIASSVETQPSDMYLSIDSHAAAHVTSSSPSSPTRSTQAPGQLPRSSPSSRPSRSAIRRLADSDQGGLAVAQAQNLQRLQRAEVDLFITGIVGALMAVSLGSLALYIDLTINELATTNSPTAEVVIFLGSWMYGGIQAVSLTAQLRSILLNGTKATAGGVVLDLSSVGGGGTLSNGVAPPMQSRVGATETLAPTVSGVAVLGYMPSLPASAWPEQDIEAGRKRSEGEKGRAWVPSMRGSRRGSKEEDKKAGEPRVAGVVVELGEPESSSASERRSSL